MTSGQFNADLFAMANKTKFKTIGQDPQDTEKYSTFKTESLTPDATTHKVTLAETPVEGTVAIRGLELTTDFTVSGKEVTFTDDKIAGPVEISYEYEVNGANVIKIDNKSAATGEAVMKWPVYGAGDDCTDSAVKGYVILRMYRCRVTQMPGFDTSYKSAATNAVTFSAMDAKRDDEKIYEIAYIDA